MKCPKCGDLIAGSWSESHNQIIYRCFDCDIYYSIYEIIAEHLGNINETLKKLVRP